MRASLTNQGAKSQYSLRTNVGNGHFILGVRTIADLEGKRHMDTWEVSMMDEYESLRGVLMKDTPLGQDEQSTLQTNLRGTDMHTSPSRIGDDAKRPRPLSPNSAGSSDLHTMPALLLAYERKS